MQGHGGSSRRRFLGMLGAGSALAVFPACGGGGNASPEAFGDANAGNVSALTVGSLLALSDAPAYVGRDADGLYAMTSTCPHEGCDMIARGSVDANGVVCDCHGSRFDTNGGVLRGPANSPLTHFAVDVDAGGNIVVHGGREVPASARTPV